MKQFIKFTFASILGFFISIFLLFLISVFFLFIFVSSFDSDTVKVVENSVIELNLNYELPERTTYDSPFKSSFIPSIEKIIGLNDIIKALENAKTDEKIIGIYLNLDDFVGGSLAKINSIRNAIMDFKSSGKFIIAHGNTISEKAYYLASVADKIFLTPTGDLEFDGYGIEVTFFKKLLDKLEIEPQIFQYGKYKSATEPFRLDKLSNENQEQLNLFLQTVYDDYLNQISLSRNIDKTVLHSIAANLIINSANDALKFGMVDSLIYKSQIDSVLIKLSSIKEKPKIIDFKKYLRSDLSGYSGDNRIAVIYALGEVSEDKGSENSIGTQNIIESLEKARNNNKVKAIVLRVNSPGGSALTSDIIWNAIYNSKSQKPIIVSMGEVAASGGYYISCAADSIVAESSTITGSIGVFGIIPNAQKFLDNKLGITFDGVKSSENSDFATFTKPLNSSQKKYVQKMVDKIYFDFLERVSKGRKMNVNDINKIAQGRIWSGVDAKKLGLIDEIGDLKFAIKLAAEKVNLKEYNLVEYPRQKEPFEKIMDMLNQTSDDNLLKLKLNKPFDQLDNLIQVLKISGIQARLPFDFNIN